TIGAVGVLALTAAGVLMLRDDGPPTSRVDVGPASSLPALPANCTATYAEPAGCHLQPTDAEAYLGFHVRTVTGVPRGWEIVREDLRAYPGADPADPARTVPLYVRVWAAPGTDFSTGTPTYIQLRERLALSADNSPCGQPPRRVVLDDGSIACGGGSDLTWMNDGVWYSLFAPGVAEDDLIQFANALR
ncbi:MAG: hypothetical protein WDA60_17475, partial [Acidimicrobiia bacterium]